MQWFWSLWAAFSAFMLCRRRVWREVDGRWVRARMNWLKAGDRIRMDEDGTLWEGVLVENPYKIFDGEFKGRWLATAEVIQIETRSL